MPTDEELVQMIGFIGSARGGRKRAAPVVVGINREIGQEDLAALANPARVDDGTPVVQKLRHSHHTLARLLAEGRKPGEVAAIMGYSNSRISILQNDPAFCELVEYYSGQAKAQFVDVHSRLAQLGTDTVEVLQERVLEKGDELSVKTLLDIAAFSLDRSVAPPKRTSGPEAAPAAAPVINIAFVGPSERFALPELPQEKGRELPGRSDFIDGDAE